MSKKKTGGKKKGESGAIKMEFIGPIEAT